YTGIGITTSSQYSSLTSCNPAPSPSVFGCNGLTLSLYGPGLSGNSQCGLILPVNLKFFAESCWQGERIFKWETASEKNNDFFSLEGSNDGKSWSSFKNIKGAINSNSVQEYSYIDKSKISLNYKYFRLSQFDIDGKSSHSPLIFASSCTDLNTEIQIFPSPGSQFISVRMPLENRQNIKGWEIRDLMAKPVITGISLQEQLDISKLANGIYFLIINTIDYPSFSSKFIVVNN
nr:hypothetical protein [Saprospiraceae bacterium]